MDRSHILKSKVTPAPSFSSQQFANWLRGSYRNPCAAFRWAILFLSGSFDLSLKVDNDHGLHFPFIRRRFWSFAGRRQVFLSVANT